MKATVYRDAAGEWRWRVQADNGNVLADSGEGYANMGHCISMLEQVTNTVTYGPTLRSEPRKNHYPRMKLEVIS